MISTNDQQTISDYFNRLQVLLNSMQACDESIDDCKVVEKVLRTLAPQFDHIVVTTEELRDFEKMTIEELQNSLETYNECLREIIMKILLNKPFK